MLLDHGNGMSCHHNESLSGQREHFLMALDKHDTNNKPPDPVKHV